MGLRELFRGTTVQESTGVDAAEHAAVAHELELVKESLQDLEQLAREDRGWRKLGTEQQQAFTRAGLLDIQAVCLVAFIKSPLIGRGVRIRRNYVWGQGVEVSARETTEGDDLGVNDVVQAFIDSADYQRVLGSAQAREERETNLMTAGEFFLLAVHDPAALTVRPRLVPPAQVTNYVANPDDATDVWFYQRVWTTNRVNLATGQLETTRRTEWHPVLGFRPPAGTRIDFIAGERVRWDQPIQHCAVNSVTDAPWGLPDVYAAIDWARAYADYLGAWAGLMKALARYAFKATAPAKQAAKVKAALANGRGTHPITGEATDPVGATAVMSDTASMAPMHSSGATIDASSGKPLAGMAAAALDVPITMLLADPGVTGAQAVATTLDRPLELTTGSRRGLWIDWQKALFAHVIDRAVEDDVLVLAEAADATVDVVFPPIEEESLAARLQALTAASELPIPPLLIVRMALEALGVEDIDEVLKGMVDDRGEFIDPRVTAAAAAVQREQDGAGGSQAAEAYR